MPSMYPEIAVAGSLKSACESNHTAPGSASPSPAIVPTAAKQQLPESTTGNAPAARARRTSAATSRISSKTASPSPEPEALKRSSSSTTCV